MTRHARRCYLHSVRRKLPVSACVVAAAVVLFLWDQLFAGQTFYLRDVICDALPWRRFAAQELANGSIPLWNPHSRFGQPFLANPQSAVLYPPHLLFVILPVGWAFKLNLLGHLLLAGTSMAALLRRFRLHHGAAAFGGIVWALGGYMTANLEFMSVMETLAWCPLTVLLAVRLADAPDAVRPLQAYVTRGALLAAAIAVPFMAGQVQPLAFALLIAAVVLVAATRSQSIGGRSLALVLGTFVAACVVAIGLTAVQWMPTRELLPLSIRANVDPGLDIASVHPRHLLHLLDPLASGAPGAATWRGGSLFEFWLGSIYLGLLPLVLVPAAFTLPRTDRALRGLTIACALLVGGGVLLAFGRHTPLYEVLLSVIPGFDLFRWPAKAFQLAVFGLTVLSAIGLHVVLRGREDEATRGRGLVSLIAAGCAVAAAALMLALGVSENVRPLFMAVCALFVVIVLRLRSAPPSGALAFALILVVLDLYGVSRQIHLVDDDAILDAAPEAVPKVRDGRVHTEYTFAQFELYGSRNARDYRLAVDLLAGDTGLSLPVDRTYGGDALQVTATRDVTALLDTLPDAERGRLLTVLGVREVLTGPPFALLRNGTGSYRWTPHAGDFRRARIVTRWSTAADRVVAMERLLSPGFDPAREAVSSAPDIDAPVPGSRGGRVTRAEYGRESVAVDVDVEGRALLVVADTWLPGWVARVDGVAREIVPTNVIFRGVMLEPGDREVRMTYEPRSFRSGVTWTGFSAIALWALVLAVLLPRRRRAGGCVNAG